MSAAPKSQTEDDVSRELQRLTLNLGGKTRREKLHGRWHTVVPAAILAEGVWPGSNGPLYYPAEELAKSVPAWNHKPIVVYHPTDESGNSVSGCLPNVLNTRQIGVTLNTKFDDKLRTECWIDEERAAQVDGRVMKLIGAGKKIEVSTGVYTDNEAPGGEWGGKKYDATAKNHAPDHLAALPDKLGAYSNADGGGMLVVNMAPNEPERVADVMRRTAEHLLAAGGIELVDNELSFTSISRQLCDLLCEKFGKPGKYWEGHVVDVYGGGDGGRVLYRAYGEDGAGMFYMMKYTVTDDAVSLVGDPSPVDRVVEYRGSGGVVLSANSAGQLVEKEEGVQDMSGKFDKKAHVATLIGNGGWTEAHRPKLEAMDDDVLANIRPITANDTTDVSATATVTTTTPVPTGAGVSDVRNHEAGTQGAPVPTWNQLLAALPAGDRDALVEMREAASRERAEHVRVITANERNTFTAEYLNSPDRSLRELRALAALARPVGETAPASIFTLNAGGNPPPAPPPVQINPLRTTDLEFGPKKTGTN